MQHIGISDPVFGERKRILPVSDTCEEAYFGRASRLIKGEYGLFFCHPVKSVRCTDAAELHKVNRTEEYRNTQHDQAVGPVKRVPAMLSLPFQ